MKNFLLSNHSQAFGVTHLSPWFLRINKAKAKHFQVFETRWASIRKMPGASSGWVKNLLKRAEKGIFQCEPIKLLNPDFHRNFSFVRG